MTDQEDDIDQRFHLLFSGLPSSGMSSMMSLLRLLRKDMEEAKGLLLAEASQPSHQEDEEGPSDGDESVKLYYGGHGPSSGMSHRVKLLERAMEKDREKAALRSWGPGLYFSIEPVSGKQKEEDSSDQDGSAQLHLVAHSKKVLQRAMDEDRLNAALRSRDPHAGIPVSRLLRKQQEVEKGSSDEDEGFVYPGGAHTLLEALELDDDEDEQKYEEKVDDDIMPELEETD